MAEKKSGSKKTDTLRQRAEQAFAERAARKSGTTAAPTAEEASRLLHELQVHQIELEMQNEELRRMQAELEASRARYFDLYDLAPVGYLVIGRKGLILEGNLTAAGLLGVGRGALAKQPFSHFVFAADQDVYYRRQQLLYETGAPQTCELRLVNKEGGSFWALMEAVVAQADDGAPLCRMVLTDITARKEAEALRLKAADLERERIEAENATRRLEAVLEAMPAGVAILDEKGGIIRSNHGFEAVWGTPPPTESFADHAAYRAWWPNTGREVQPEEWAAPRAAKTGKPVENQLVEIQRFDGSRAFVLNSAAPVRDAAGRVVGSVVAIRDISELHRAEDALRESEERFRSAFEDSAIGMTLTGPDGRLIKVNDAFCRLVGYSAAELDQRDFADITHPDDRPANLAGIQAMVRGETSTFRMEKRYFRKDGRVIWVDISAAAVRDRDGRPLYFVTHLQDINERKAQEHRIARLTNLFSVLSRVNEAIVRVDDEAELYGEVCGIIGESSGYPLVWVGRVYNGHVVPIASCGPEADYLHEIDVETHGELGQGPTGTCIRENKPVINDDFAVNKSMSPWRKPAIEHGFRSSAAFPLCRDSKPVGALTLYASEPSSFDQEQVQLLESLAADISYALDALDEGRRRAKAEEALRESEERYRTLFNTMDEGFCVIEVLFDEADRPVDYRFLKINAAFERQTGMHDAEGQLMKTLAPDHEAHWFELYGEIAKTGVPLHFTNEARALNRYYEVSAYRVGRPEDRQVAIIFNDMSEQKRAADQLRELNATLERRVEERTAQLAHRATQLRALAAQLAQAEEQERKRLAQVLHDHLQQLLVAAKFGTTILRQRLAAPDLNAEAQRVLDLIAQSIDASRSLTMELSPPVLHEAGLGAGLMWLARWMREKHGLDVEVSAQDLPAPLPEGVRLMCFRAVRELLFNVAKHAGVKRAEVTMTQDEGRSLRIVVADQGTGFDAEAHAAGNAPGFGLFSIRERLEFLDGRLEIESAPGQGSRFILTAPIVQAAAAEPSGFASPATAASEPSASAPGGIRVLVVDDHTVVRKGLVEILQKQAGVAVVGEAADGRQALEQARLLKPDVVLMDVTMPRMSGIEATRSLVYEMPNVRVIGLSMHAQDDMAAQMRAAGAVSYLVKDGPIEDLVAAVRAAATEN